MESFYVISFKNSPLFTLWRMKIQACADFLFLMILKCFLMGRILYQLSMFSMDQNE